MISRRLLIPLGLPGLLISTIICGCGGNPGDALPALDNGPTASEPPVGNAPEGGNGLSDGSVPDRGTLLRAVVELVKSAPTNPGGSHFDIAKDYLNQFFASAKTEDFSLSSADRSYLAARLGEAAPRAIPELEVRTFTVRDARHIEDCLLLSTVARRVAGDGEDLDRVQRVFEWLMLQVQLVPAGSLAIPGGGQAQARPYDVLMRGMATEEGGWAERSWLFMALCRQLGIDVGLLVYTPTSRGAIQVPPSIAAASSAPPPAQPQRMIWICTAIVEGRPYLFDCRMGRPIPGPNGQGVATLNQAIEDPSILNQLDLPGTPYSTDSAELRSTKLTIWVDSSLGHLSARMRELQKELDQTLASRERMVLFRTPSEQHEAFAAALGDRFADTELWFLPMQVEYQLFNDPAFVEATQYAIAIFDSKLPLLHARLGQLRGDLKEAVESYAGFRFADKPVQNDGKTPIPSPLQDVLNQYATYYLGLAKLDQGQLDRAKTFFDQTLQMLPEPGPSAPYYALYRWGAHTNLGYLLAEKGQRAEAVRHLTQPQPTPQEFGNLLRARDLIWESPFVPEAVEQVPADTSHAAATPGRG